MPLLQRRKSLDETTSRANNPIPEERRLRRRHSTTAPSTTAPPPGAPKTLNLRPFAASCAVCAKMCEHRCRRCGVAFYCSKAHSDGVAEHAKRCRIPATLPYVYNPNYHRDKAANAVPITTQAGPTVSVRFASASASSSSFAAQRQPVDGIGELQRRQRQQFRRHGHGRGLPVRADGGGGQMHSGTVARWAT